MKVKLIKEYNEIPVGSVIEVEKVLKNSYKGKWSSFMGSFNVDVKKECCEIISDNNDLIDVKDKKSKKVRTKSQNKKLITHSLLEEIKLDSVYGSKYCKYSVIENKLEKLYKNQEKLLQAIRLLGNMV